VEKPQATYGNSIDDLWKFHREINIKTYGIYIEEDILPLSSSRAGRRSFI
jgi:hypothetical protein